MNSELLNDLQRWICLEAHVDWVGIVTGLVGQCEELQRRLDDTIQHYREESTKIEQALDACDIAGIYTAFRNPVDAIQQMAAYIEELSKWFRPMPCGHPHIAEKLRDDGTRYCSWCEDIDRAYTRGFNDARRPERGVVSRHKETQKS